MKPIPKEGKENPTSILTENIEPEILEKLPEWFRILRKKYQEMREQENVQP